MGAGGHASRDLDTQTHVVDLRQHKVLGVDVGVDLLGAAAQERRVEDRGSEEWKASEEKKRKASDHSFMTRKGRDLSDEVDVMVKRWSSYGKRWMMGSLTTPPPARRWLAPARRAPRNRASWCLHYVGDL